MRTFFLMVAVAAAVCLALPPAYGRGLLPGKLDVYARSEGSEPCSQSTKAACNKDEQCTWCMSAAVRSSCFPISQAKHLPPAVFVCDKLGLEELLVEDNDNTREMAVALKEMKRSKKSSQKNKKKKQPRESTV